MVPPSITFDGRTGYGVHLPRRLFRYATMCPFSTHVLSPRPAPRPRPGVRGTHLPPEDLRPTGRRFLRGPATRAPGRRGGGRTRSRGERASRSEGASSPPARSV